MRAHARIAHRFSFATAKIFCIEFRSTLKKKKRPIWFVFTYIHFTLFSIRGGTIASIKKM